MRTTAKSTVIMIGIISLLLTRSAVAVTIEMVPVGNAGNAPDTEIMTDQDRTTGYGSVGYSFLIGKYEVTAGQYTEFLNAVAKDDPNGLYFIEMGDPIASLGPNIQRAGSSPNYSYSVAPDWANRPVNWVTFWSAARFVNWLDNGQPVGPQGPGTTEDGSYHDVGNQTLFGRNPGVKYYLPTEDEWYKAAYHDKTAGLAGNYFDYPTASNTAPINTLPDPGNHANFYDSLGTGNNGSTIGSPYWRTNVGEFVNSASPYGTFDQGGNEWEWNEAVLYSSMRGIRGGSWNSGSVQSLHAKTRSFQNPTLPSGYDLGFRVVISIQPIPEPGSLRLIVTGVTTLLLWRRRT